MKRLESLLDMACRACFGSHDCCIRSLYRTHPACLVVDMRLFTGSMITLPRAFRPAPLYLILISPNVIFYALLHSKLQKRIEVLDTVSIHPNKKQHEEHQVQQLVHGHDDV